jgi:hypothetical protein
MRILPSRSCRVNLLGLLVVLLSAGTMSCENKHIGRPCELSVGPDAGGTTTTLDVGLECPSRICLLPTRETFSQDPPTTAMCTADCSSDDDCADGELRNTKSNPSGCVLGFTCKVAETVGDFCCRKLCVCKDFSGKPPTGGFPTPQVCTSSPVNQANCRNVQ